MPGGSLQALCHPIDRLHEHLCARREKDNALTLMLWKNFGKTEILHLNLSTVLREQVEPLLLCDGLLAKQLKDYWAHQIPLVLKLEGPFVLREGSRKIKQALISYLTCIPHWGRKLGLRRKYITVCL